MRLGLIASQNRTYGNIDGNTSLFPANLVHLIAELDQYIEVKVFDRSHYKNDHNFINDISLFDPVLIGFSCQYPCFPHLTTITKKLKERLPNTIIVLGGPAIYRLPELFLKYNQADYGCIGHGPTVINDSIKTIQNSNDLRAVPGLCYLTEGSLIYTPGTIGKTPRDIDFKRSVENIYKSFDMKFYQRNDIFFPLLYSWGCVFASAGKCQYCDSGYQELYCSPTPKVFWRRRTAENIEKEIRFLIANYNIERFTFLDGNFISHDMEKQRLLQTLKVIEKPWQCMVRADMIVYGGNRTAKMLKDCGCKLIWIGGDETLYNAPIRKFDQEDVFEAVKYCNSAGIEVVIYVLLGLCEQGPEELQEIKNFFIRLKENGLKTYAFPNRYLPYPGTAMFKKALSKLPKGEDSIPDILKGITHEYYQGDCTQLIVNLSECKDEDIADCIRWLQDYNR